jgi:hypothetical protein
MKVENLVVGVIGLGMGALHLKGAIEYGAKIGMICDTNPEQLKKIGDENNIPEDRRTADYHDIVNNKEINVVLIATPDQQHRTQVEECLAAGKHIMCEKPLALVRDDLVAMVNAVNLTDGLDGLASGCTVIVSLFLAIVGSTLGYTSPTIFSAAIAGACLGFLLFNRYPAKVFMGDTGSLALGGGVAALALLTNTELLLVILGGVYVAEAASVIIQVTYFRLTGGKRIFRMSPLHHHFELGGWRETKVVAVFTGVSVVLSLVSVGFFLMRIYNLGL